MRTLAIDLGAKRIGLALSDEGAAPNRVALYGAAPRLRPAGGSIP